MILTPTVSPSTAADGTNAKFEVFRVVWDGTNSNWKLTLQEGATIDHEDPDLDNDKLLHFDIHVTDGAGTNQMCWRVDVKVENVQDGPHLSSPMGAGLIMENVLGADSGITFAASDEDAMAIRLTLLPAILLLKPAMAPTIHTLICLNSHRWATPAFGN